MEREEALKEIEKNNRTISELTKKNGELLREVKNSELESDWVSCRTASVKLDCSIATVYNWICNRTLESKKVGGRTYVKLPC